MSTCTHLVLPSLLPQREREGREIQEEEEGKEEEEDFES